MWRSQLLDLIAGGGFRTQSELVAALRSRGHDLTQSTVSRELSAQGIRKLGGRYVGPVAQGLPPGLAVLEGAIASGPLVVLKTAPAMAALLAQAIDDARFPFVLGTIAGENTVFVACTAHPNLGALRAFVSHPIPENSP